MRTVLDNRINIRDVRGSQKMPAPLFIPFSDTAENTVTKRFHKCSLWAIILSYSRVGMCLSFPGQGFCS